LRAVEWVDDEDSDVSVFEATFQSRGCNMNFAFETKTLASKVITLGVSSRGLFSHLFKRSSICDEANSFL